MTNNELDKLVLSKKETEDESERLIAERKAAVNILEKRVIQRIRTGIDSNGEPLTQLEEIKILSKLKPEVWADKTIQYESKDCSDDDLQTPIIKIRDSK